MQVKYAQYPAELHPALIIRIRILQIQAYMGSTIKPSRRVEKEHLLTCPSRVASMDSGLKPTASIEREPLFTRVLVRPNDAVSTH